MKSNLFEPVVEALALELGDYQPVEDIETFSRFTEGRQYLGHIFFNPVNIIFTNKADYEHCKYYNQKGPVCELTLPTYDLNLFILDIGDSRLLKDALKI